MGMLKVVMLAMMGCMVVWGMEIGMQMDLGATFSKVPRKILGKLPILGAS